MSIGLSDELVEVDPLRLWSFCAPLTGKPDAYKKGNLGKVTLAGPALSLGTLRLFGSIIKFSPLTNRSPDDHLSVNKEGHMECFGKSGA